MFDWIRRPFAKSEAPPETAYWLRAGGYRIMVDRATQILRLDTNDRAGGHPVLEARPRIQSSFVSAALLAQKAKQFDDGLYAAVELAAQSGAGQFQGKQTLIRAALEKIDSLGAAEILYSAAKLGGAAIEPPEGVARAVESWTEGFLKDELRSKPLGFYTWTPELARIFQQDRALQTELDQPAAAELVGLMRDSEVGGPTRSASSSHRN